MLAAVPRLNEPRLAVTSPGENVSSVEPTVRPLHLRGAYLAEDLYRGGVLRAEPWDLPPCPYLGHVDGHP